MESKLKSVALLLTIFGWQISSIYGHGMLLNPISRGSRWRKDPSAPRNYNDNQLYCGGFQTQWNVNEGKCGLCGDSYSDTRPREHENGGTYGQGVIVDTYKAGQTIPVDVLITANHKGYFLYDLCNLDASSESDECFAVHKLKLANGQDRYTVPNGLSDVFFNTTLVLPTNLDCKQCVLRWTYVTGNSWGDCADGTGAVGCGAQENFRGCSDVRVVGDKTDRQLDNDAPIEMSSAENSPRDDVDSNELFLTRNGDGREEVTGGVDLDTWQIVKNAP